METKLDILNRTKRKLNYLTIKEKLEILDDLENGYTRLQIKEKFGIPQSTLSCLLGNKEKLQKQARLNPACLSNKKIRKSNNPELERAIVIFVKQSQQNGIPISGTIVREKAKSLANQLNITNFSASSGWLTRFNKRHGFNYRGEKLELKHADFGFDFMDEDDDDDHADEDMTRIVKMKFEPELEPQQEQDLNNDISCELHEMSNDEEHEQQQPLKDERNCKMSTDDIEMSLKILKRAALEKPNVPPIMFKYIIALETFFLDK